MNLEKGLFPVGFRYQSVNVSCGHMVEILMWFSLAVAFCSKPDLFCTQQTLLDNWLLLIKSQWLNGFQEVIMSQVICHMEKIAQAFQSSALRYDGTSCSLLSILEYGSGAGTVVRLCREPCLVSNLSVVDADHFWNPQFTHVQFGLELWYCNVYF